MRQSLAVHNTSMATIKPEITAESSIARGWLRRHWLLGAVAAVAAVSGAVLAWRKSGLGPQSLQAEKRLWNSSFLTPDASPVAMSSLKGRPLVLNFWATWCPPCVEEFDLLDAFYKKNAANGWQVLGLALDQENSVKRFLAQSPVAFPIAMGGLEGAAMGKSLGNSTGGLPFTVVLDRDGLIRQRKMGQLSQQDLQAWREMIR